jgi:hypothetical protein
MASSPSRHRSIRSAYSGEAWRTPRSVSASSPGRDRYDSTSADVEVDDYVATASETLKGVVIGRPREYFPDSLDARHSRAL